MLLYLAGTAASGEINTLEVDVHHLIVSVSQHLSSWTCERGTYLGDLLDRIVEDPSDILDSGSGDQTIHSAVLGSHLLEDDVLASGITNIGLHIAESASVLLGDLVLDCAELLAWRSRAVDGVC